MSTATEVGTVYLVLENGEYAHEGGNVVAVFETKAEAQGFCYKHEPHLYWLKRSVWKWPEVVNPDLPGYYAGSFSDTAEYDLARPPKTEAQESS